MSELTRSTIGALAVAFVERASSLGYKGKQRDKAALDFFIGAIKLAELQGNTELYNHLGNVAALLIAIRGYSEVVRLSDAHINDKNLGKVAA